jgi:hypothetical protein
MNQFEIRLTPRTDRNGDEYLIGGSDLPALVDLRDSTFVVFYPKDEETLKPGERPRATLVIRKRQAQNAGIKSRNEDE